MTKSRRILALALVLAAVITLLLLYSINSTTGLIATLVLLMIALFFITSGPRGGFERLRFHMAVLGILKVEVEGTPAGPVDPGTEVKPPAKKKNDEESDDEGER